MQIETTNFSRFEIQIQVKEFKSLKTSHFSII